MTAYGMWNLVALLAFAAFSESAVALPAAACPDGSPVFGGRATALMQTIWLIQPHARRGNAALSQRYTEADVEAQRKVVERI